MIFGKSASFAAKRSGGFTRQSCLAYELKNAKRGDQLTCYLVPDILMEQSRKVHCPEACAKKLVIGISRFP